MTTKRHKKRRCYKQDLFSEILKLYSVKIPKIYVSVGKVIRKPVKFK